MLRPLTGVAPPHQQEDGARLGHQTRAAMVGVVRQTTNGANGVASVVRLV